MGSEVRWLPLESNPDVMTKFLTNLGVSKEWGLVDVLGFDSELLAMVPQPVVALILLFPVKEESSTAKGQESAPGADKSGVYFMKQTIRNACGTIALIHAVANNREKIAFNDQSLLKAFLDETLALDPESKGKQLEKSADICSSHEICAQEGQTSAPQLDQEVDFHFIALVEKNGQLLEMDGRKEGPINHGATSADTFLEDGARVCREFMEKNPECLNFTAVALAKL